jgi:hypothetical protein
MRWAVAAVLLVACTARDQAGSSAAAESAPSKLSADDVTVLVPLSSLDAMTARDGLLPDAIASQVGQLVEHYTADDTLARLRVVCARFDACAPSFVGGPACNGEVRLVMQPLLETDGVLGAQDAAVHLFYDLGVADKPALANAIAAHSDLPTLIHDFTGRATLTRVTFIRNTDVKGNGWVFGGFDVRAGIATALTVPRVSGNTQSIVINGSGPFGASIAPAPSGTDTLGLLLDPTRLDILKDANPAAAQQQIDNGISAATALEDPQKHDATNADCASCHLAETARRLGQALPPLPTAADTLRACGYVGGRPVKSQRTVNESALAAQRMGALLP